MKNWLFLTVAILCEVVATSALKASDGFTKPWASALVVVGYGVAFYCLSITLRTIPVGVAYAIWSGAGIVLVALIAWVKFSQKPDLPTLIGMALIISGVAVMNLFSKSLPH